MVRRTSGTGIFILAGWPARGRLCFAFAALPHAGQPKGFDGRLVPLDSVFYDAQPVQYVHGAGEVAGAGSGSGVGEAAVEGGGVVGVEGEAGVEVKGAGAVEGAGEAEGEG